MRGGPRLHGGRHGHLRLRADRRSGLPLLQHPGVTAVRGGVPVSEVHGDGVPRAARARGWLPGPARVRRPHRHPSRRTRAVPTRAADGQDHRLPRLDTRWLPARLRERSAACGLVAYRAEQGRLPHPAAHRVHQPAGGCLRGAACMGPSADRWPPRRATPGLRVWPLRLLRRLPRTQPALPRDREELRVGCDRGVGPDRGARQRVPRRIRGAGRARLRPGRSSRAA